MRNEASIIARLGRIIPSRIGVRASRDVPLGIGDDAALVELSRGCELVLSTDAFVEGAHFLAHLHPADAVGYKALSRAVSDLAAMGAAPRYFLLTLALPAGKVGAWLDLFARGMARAARRFGMRLIGGDVSRHDRVVAALTVMGEVRRGHALTRSGAHPGEALYVTGRLGAAQAGLELLLREGPRGIARRADSYSLKRHLYPDPRLGVGAWLGAKKLTSAAMDISDGLSTDLARLCAASGVGAVVNASLLPVFREERPGVRRASAGRDGAAALRRALHGGEDYELLFSVPRRLVTRIPGRLGSIPLTRIGEITRGRHVVLVDSMGRARPLLPGGWEHFGRARSIR
ncbi:MAG TPA: thiamine-phosphate kinase [Candidatus Acidoferrales bacterium]|nr:thiamine-phosphate kinase [Candidatus Acidoferrales bacterium]